MRGVRAARDLAVACDKLIRSARIFRETLAQTDTKADVSREYVKMIGMGIMAAQSVNERAADEQAAFRPDPNAILLAPAYAYLTNDFRGLYRRYQFWLNTNSLDWYRRIVQPLTHPYVLSRNWLRRPLPAGMRCAGGEGSGGRSGQTWTNTASKTTPCAAWSVGWRIAARARCLLHRRKLICGARRRVGRCRRCCGRRLRRVKPLEWRIHPFRMMVLRATHLGGASHVSRG